MDVFSTVHNPKNWDLISHSDGEYFEISSDSSISDIDDLPNISKIRLESDSSDSDETFIADIKMFCFNKTDNLQNQIDQINTQLAQLAPSQLIARRRLKEKLESLEKRFPCRRISDGENFVAREFDSMFKPLYITEASQDTGINEINTLKKKINSLESSIKSTRS